MQRSRQLMKDRGILEDSDPNKGGRSLSDDIKQRVIAFYESEEYSRICSGKKEFVVVRDGGVKSHTNKSNCCFSTSMSSTLLIKQIPQTIKLASPSFVSCDLHGACQLRQLVCIMPVTPKCQTADQSHPRQTTLLHKSARFYELNAADHQRTTCKFEAWRVTLGNPQVLQWYAFTLAKGQLLCC